jgi:hypothetical protein
MLREAIFRDDELEQVGRPTPVAPPLSFGESVQLNSGGPTGLVVDIVGDDHLAVAWRESESIIPRPCLKRFSS